MKTSPCLALRRPLRVTEIGWLTRCLNASRCDEQMNTPKSDHGIDVLISVIVPTYARPDSLVRALQSIISQTYPHFEVLVINDGAEDIEELIDGLDPGTRIRYFRHEHNKGRSAARNTGLAYARGQYIAYLDDDDVYYPDHLETLVSFLESADYEVAYTDGLRAHKQTQGGELVTVKKDQPFSAEFDIDQLLLCNFIPVLCVMHSRECTEIMGGFDTKLDRLEDWDLLVRISRRYRFKHLESTTCEYSWRSDDANTSTASVMKFYLAENYLRYKNRKAMRACRLYPEMRARFMGFVWSLISAAKLDDAVRLLEDKLGYEPEDNDLLFELATLFSFRGEPVMAVTCLERIKPVSNESKPDFERTLEEAMALVESQRPDQALRHIRWLLQYYPTNGAIYDAAAKILGGLKRSTDALVYLRLATTLQPDSINYCRDTAELLANSGRMDEALLYAKRLQQLAPDDAGVLAFLKEIDAQGDR